MAELLDTGRHLQADLRSGDARNEAAGAGAVLRMAQQA
jgi:hypothetical protein